MVWWHEQDKYLLHMIYFSNGQTEKKNFYFGQVRNLWFSFPKLRKIRGQNWEKKLVKTCDEFVTKDVEFSECTRSPECSIIEVGICESVNNPIICQSNSNGTEVSFRYVNVSRNLGKVKRSFF